MARWLAAVEPSSSSLLAGATSGSAAAGGVLAVPSRLGSNTAPAGVGSSGGFEECVVLCDVDSGDLWLSSSSLSSGRMGAARAVLQGPRLGRDD